MELLKTPLPGLLLVRNFTASDPRGLFVKTFRADVFVSAGLNFQIRESFYSISQAGVIRGMHFQKPPYGQAKLVCCPAGEVEDVVLDIRKGSPTYGRYWSVRLTAENALGLFIPEGFAHGFQAIKDQSLMVYYVSCENQPEVDMGLRWDSFGFTWPLAPTAISERDRQWPLFNRSFSSPFD
ncbi:MAG: dTDP-4-dehydrorhamnose 3,5-epimerase family protein [Flavobacteriales bacterium]|nr:dTDP-4-dehydrorhamnose 3,5-epimerase family protein [Flavobacteriales bacterium]